MQSRLLVSGFDRSANSEVAKYLAKEKDNAMVLSEHEFQKAIECPDKRQARYGWLNTVVDMERMYHQDIIVLWFSKNDKKKIREQNPDNKTLLGYCNELLFTPYSNKLMNTIRTHIYFVDISQRVRLSDTADIINNNLGKEDIATFEAEDTIIWSYPYEILELVRND